ncbi:MAG: branched-chain amino acid ABC transporter permease [Rhodospirillaceae bacterium]|nr:branched-chain amino acid ABC transporter permease [Rhodospirillaceae bacterium]MBT5192915.1 branched-chain amino acid ABC transporter permease [Rhodospirillaceae bacterium]MBT6427659.1 branched-chain amino acid ABC transporter permease [Rhodospirillaceae bacterium]MBT7758882.1 branched-chain amino acid ABC transporter permease [Rhodospirillaceae bacterium]
MTVAMTERALAARNFIKARERWHWAEALPWLAIAGAFFVFPDYLALGTQLIIAIIFALSLDLILGYAGIITLGHAAYFGAGAYATGMLSAHLGWGEPISAMLFGGLVGGVLGFLSGWILLRYHGLTLLMLTLATAILLQEGANAAEEWTGGFDGLVGISIQPLLGSFEYDLWGKTYFCYSAVVLLLCFLIARTIVHSAFGRSLAGIKGNVERMHGIGTPVHGRLVTIYTISAAMAGVAGGLFAESNAYVTLDVLSFARSGTVLIMLVLGGTGRLYGAFVGTAVYMILEDELAKLSPEFWEFGIGLLLVIVVLFFRRGLMGALEDLRRRLGGAP